MGSQKHTSPLKHADDDGALTWDLKCPLVAQTPVRNRIVKVELHTTSSRKKAGKLVALALVPLFQLMGFSQGGPPPPPLPPVSTTAHCGCTTRSLSPPWLQQPKAGLGGGWVCVCACVRVHVLQAVLELFCLLSSWSVFLQDSVHGLLRLVSSVVVLQTRLQLLPPSCRGCVLSY